ncbi:putative ankyrin repeat protein [Parachaetomium inaequale]|uniref:Ankyrin repeat protein n=1 Tax=Parachaetomium inaequale TaxID=2588326 RepID=A0AAN6PNI4_9PEZI|nr:putative ankyrin repeat protein [Parachaetomium inaequale]
MADPLSVAGSIVGLISLGLSVTQHIFDYYAAAKDRETKLGGTIAKLEQLLKVFEAIRTQAEARKTRPDEHGLLSNMLAAVQRCEECIEELREEADKFREYPGQARRLGTAARATVRRITYPFRQSTLQRIEEDIDEILSQLSVAQQALIQNELSHVRDDVEDTKALLEQVRASQISLEIRQWLDAPDATTNFNLACANKHPGTGLWLVRGSPFSEWLQKPNSFLWLRGFAGCGKSVLSSTAIQHTYRHLRGVPKAGIAFFYFSFSDSSKQSVEAMLRALILQLSSQIQGDSQLLALYRRHREGTPPYQGLITCLFQIVQQFSDVYIVVDALDESPRGPYRDAVLQALAEMRTWSSGPKLHLLVTSRDEIDIREELQANPEEVVVIKNDSVQRDIALFVSQHLRQNRRLRKWERYHDRIEEILTTRAKGVFRWVECQFKALASCPRSEHLLEQLLQSLPETLDETYRRMLLNIPSPSAPYARQMLTLLCCSERPLKVSELVDAVAVELADHQTPRYNPKRRLEDEYALQEVCLGFTELGVDPRTGEPTIQIAHSSVQEFLESERLAENDDIKAFSIERTSAHTQMAHICLTFLLDPNLAFSAEQYPFLFYAAKYWPRHFLGSSASESVETRVLQLFQSSRCLFLNWVYLWNATRPSSRVTQIQGDMPRWNSSLPLYFASYLGLPSIISKLLGRPSPVQVQLSLAHGADINGRDWQGKTALSISTELGYTEIVQLLLEEGADIHTPDSHWGSPLRIALEDGRQAIAELLIKAGGDVDRRDAYGWNLLHWASWDGRLSVAEQLLGRGTPPTALDNLGRSPLFLAASAGRLALARMLLARAPSMKDRKDHYGLTPLSAAVIKGNTFWWTRAGGGGYCLRGLGEMTT